MKILEKIGSRLARRLSASREDGKQIATGSPDRLLRCLRPVGLSGNDIDKVINYVVARLGDKYDLRNIIDLAKYLFPVPPIPARFRRRLLALGSADPTQAICSTLIAQAFQSIKYPILPEVVMQQSNDPACKYCLPWFEEKLSVRFFSPLRLTGSSLILRKDGP